MGAEVLNVGVSYKANKIRRSNFLLTRPTCYTPCRSYMERSESVRNKRKTVGFQETLPAER